MPEKNQIIQDVSLLYELSLSVGNTLDPEENCYNFLRTLISRKSLNFGAIWLHQSPDFDPARCNLFFVYPRFRGAETSISCSPYILQELSTKSYFSVSSKSPHFDEIIHEKKVGKGAYAIFRLGNLGFLKLFASNRPNGFPEIEMAQLKQVVDKLKISLTGCFAHLQLKTETKNRIYAQKALEESENKLRRIIDSSLDAVISIDNQGNTIEWNAQAEKMFGYARAEAMCKNLEALIIPTRYSALYQEALREHLHVPHDTTASNKRYEINCIRKNQTIFPVELSIATDNNHTLFVGFFKDITEQQKARKEIEQARNLMETMIANLQTGILLEDSSGRIALANKSFCDIFSITFEPQKLIGLDCKMAAEQSKNLFQDPDSFIQSTHDAIKNGMIVENEVLNMADGRIIERNFIPLFARHKFEGQLWQYRDITEREHNQKAILESEEKYRGVLENMALGLLEVDLEDTILRANNAFCQMVGYEPAELIGINAGNQFLTDSYKKIISERLDERKMDQASVYEIQMKRKNGELIWGLISGAPVKNSQGQIVGSIGIQFDLTDRKKLENELAEAKMIADRARLAERQFLTHMSHEIRTPINAVIGMTHLLDETKPNTVQKDYLNSLRFSADSLLGIIDNILDLSKIDAGEVEFEQKPFDLEYLVHSLVQTIHYRISKKDVEISCYVDPSIENVVIGDPTRLNQILTNLLGNATKFTEKGVISVSIKLLEKSDEQYLLEVRVHDSGIGIAADKLETIFEYFKQADVQINRKFGGTGLGLTIVKQLVEMQGGSIRVESELGVGSDFIFSLLMGNSGIPVLNHKILSDIDQLKSQKIKKNLHFLIVEDNLMNQKLICKTIETWECTFEVANNGLEALEKTAATRFDVILMDIHMPELDGCETTLAIRSNMNNPNQNVPIIALTAAAMSDEKRRAFEAGMNGFLTKPIAPKMLQEHILRSIRELSEPIETIVNTSKKSSLMDLGYLMEMSNGDTHFIGTIIDAFLAETPTALKNLEAFVHQQNWDQVYKLAHKMKPNFAMLGMHHLQEMTADLELFVKKTPVIESESASLAYSLISLAEKILPLLVQQKKQLLRPPN